MEYVNFESFFTLSTSNLSSLFHLYPVSPLSRTIHQILTPAVQPTRHALGALLLEQGQFTTALEIYKADLGLNDTLPRAQRHLNNVWSLHGYHECLVKLGHDEQEEEVRQAKRLLDEALKGADVVIGSSCFCRVGGDKAVTSEVGCC